MKTTFSENFTRGGQVAMHRLRMFTQISKTTLFITIILTALYSLISLYMKVSHQQWQLYKEYLYADFIIHTTFEDPKNIYQEFRHQNGQVMNVRCIDILNNKYMFNTYKFIAYQLHCLISSSIWVAIVSFLLTTSFFVIRGRQQSVKRIERGNKVCSVKELTQLIYKRHQASDLKLNALPLVKNKETSHILVTGTTGSGKSNCIHTLIPQIKARGDQAIVVDLTGDYVSAYYDSKKDIILNPFDERSSNWSIWDECESHSQFDAFSEACIPKGNNSQESFWENASHKIFSTALQKLKGSRDQSIAVLYNILVLAGLREYSEFFRNTEAATFTDIQGDKTTLSIRATLVSHISFLKHLVGGEEKFSIRKWIDDIQGGGWLFLSARADQRKTLIPLITAWLDTAINAMMTLPLQPQRRIWLIIDELPALLKIPSLELGLAELRKYGGCILVGMQSMPQLITLYGRSQSQSILDLFNTKLFFRNTDPNTTAWVSKILDEAETIEAQENLSYGANTIRDGVSISQQQRQKALILPTEIASLNDLECYIKLPGNWPISKLQMIYHKPVAKNDSFVAKQNETISVINSPDKFSLSSSNDTQFKSIIEELV